MDASSSRVMLRHINPVLCSATALVAWNPASSSFYYTLTVCGGARTRHWCSAIFLP
jgi:hypothetical protein